MAGLLEACTARVELTMKLYRHQRREVEEHGLKRARGLLWCPRAGKSRATLGSALRMRQQGMIDSVLISSPNETHINWVVQELRPVLGESAVWHWDTRLSDDQLRSALVALPRDFRVLSIPSHLWALPRARWLWNALQKWDRGRMLLVADESDEYATPSAKRSRRLRAWAHNCGAQRILTGTPWHDSVLHAWAQLEILGPGVSGYTKNNDFARRYGQWETRFGPHGSFPSLVGYQHVDEFMARVREHCSILTADDIPDMPRTVNRLLDFAMHPSTQEVFDEVLADVELTGGGLFGRLQQIAGMCPWRLDYTAKLTERWPFVVVWCRYRDEIDALSELLPQAYVWYAGTPPATRAYVREHLRGTATDQTPMVLIAQPQACARGLDFSRAEAMIFHSVIPSARLHAQALQRATAIGSGTTPVYYICNSGIDAYILQRVRTKARFARITMGDIEELKDYSLMPASARQRKLWKKPESIDIRQL